jgi:3-hydroxyisobutyrate dehydrogenase-like beta-hydroxyacid dehydrogenase
MDRTVSLAFIGFGEAAQAFCEGWGAQPPGAIRAFDIKTTGAAAAAKRVDYARWQVTGCDRAADALRGAEAVLSLVTADQALAAATDAAAGLAPGSLSFDMNSVAPETKRAAATALEAAGGRYVDVAVMAPVRPALLSVPLLVAGPDAEAGQALLERIGVRARVVPGDIGAASAIKMLRSIVIKGLEALTAECLLSARAAEMRDSAATAAALGQSGAMAAATADWQQRLGSLGLSPLPEGLAAKADAVLAVTGKHDQ